MLRGWASEQIVDVESGFVFAAVKVAAEFHFAEDDDFAEFHLHLAGFWKAGFHAKAHSVLRQVKYDAVERTR
jgi:hypothetical protein